SQLDGSDTTVFARGLRNTIGFDWHPDTGELYGMDHGIDWLGDEEQKEELNLLTENAHYGWPFIYGDGKANPADQPENMSYEEFSEKVTMPLLLYNAHAAPLDMIFYQGEQFLEEYRQDAFITMHGSWNRSEPVGYNIVRLRFENNQPVEFEEFVTGFLVDNNTSHFGRVCGITTHPDGSLLVTDDHNGVIYRIAYQP
ncbi:MAG: sorbosone dehydrogenase family protein, partial [Bacteroidia bacterium]|nr:sorbosone dehydrogenase family protein [Bacteroidia bacterium]